MTTITFSQTTSANGQIVLALSSADLPLSGFTFSLGMTYTGTAVQFSKISFTGSSSTSVSSNSTDSSGTVNITGSVTPGSNSPFASIYFDANGTGVFDANIGNMKINGIAPVFVDPAAYNYKILNSEVNLLQGEAASGVVSLPGAFFTPNLTVTKSANHGSISVGDPLNASKWTYQPDSGFYGLDTFTVRISDGFTNAENAYSVNVSPVGTANNDVFHSSAANFLVDGGAGIDALKYAGKSTDFTVLRTTIGFVVTDKTGQEGINTLDNFERLQFSDSTIALDISGNAGQAYRIYQAAFNRAPDATGLGYWISVMDGGMSLRDVAKGFMDSTEFQIAYGSNPANSAMVTKFYENILHRAPEAAGLAYWAGLLDTAAASKEEVLANISESAENQTALIGIIGNGFAYTPFGA